MEFPQFFLVMSGWFSGSSVSVISFFGERVYIYTYKYLSIHMYINIYTPIYIQCTRSQCRNYRNCRLGTFFAILRLGSCCGGCGRFGSPEADRLVHRRLRRNTAGRGKSSEPNSFFFSVRFVHLRGIFSADPSNDHGTNIGRSTNINQPTALAVVGLEIPWDRYTPKGFKIDEHIPKPF